MRVLKSGGIYVVSGVGSRLMPFLALPLSTSLLAPEEYGQLAVFLGFNALFLAAVGMSVQTNVTLDFFNKPHSELARTMGAILRLLGLSGAVATALAVAVALIWPEGLFSLPSWSFVAMPILAVLSGVSAAYSALLRAEQAAGEYAGFELGRSAMSLSIGLGVLASTDLGWIAMVLGVAIAEMIIATVAIMRLRGRGLIDFEAGSRWSSMTPLIAISIPLIPHTLGNAVIAISDRAFIEAMVGARAVAMYAIGYSFGQVMALLTDAVAKAWTPWVYASLVRSNESELRKVVGSCYLIAGFFVIAALAIGAASEQALRVLVAPSYEGAADFVAWVTVAYAVRGIYQVFFPFLVHLRATWYLAISTGLAAVLNLILNYLLIDRFGAIGAAYATAASFAVSAILVFQYQIRRVRMPWLKPDVRFG